MALQEGTDTELKTQSVKTKALVAGTSNFNDGFESSNAAMVRLIEWSDNSVSDLTLADGESNNALTINLNFQA